MEEFKRDGSTELTDFGDWYEPNNSGVFWEYLLRQGNRAVALHKPGSTVQTKDGKKYKIDENGAWRKI